MLFVWDKSLITSYGDSLFKMESGNSAVWYFGYIESRYFPVPNPNIGKYAIEQTDGDRFLMRKSGNIDCHVGRFRKLTPRECLRLMGFDDSFKIVVSDTAAYKQAGNSIIVNVLMALLKEIDITKYGI